MMTRYLLVQISAESREQADKILNDLLEKRLVTGGQIISAPARFLWKGEVINMDYCTITSYTLRKHKKAIVEAVRKTSVEEVPMISFVPFEGNEELLKWIEKTVD